MKIAAAAVHCIVTVSDSVFFSTTVARYFVDESQTPPPPCVAYLATIKSGLFGVAFPRHERAPFVILIAFAANNLRPYIYIYIYIYIQHTQTLLFVFVRTARSFVSIAPQYFVRTSPSFSRSLCLVRFARFLFVVRFSSQPLLSFVISR